MSSTRITWTQNPRTAAPDDQGTRTGTGAYRGCDVTVTVASLGERGLYAVKAYVDQRNVYGQMVRASRFDATAAGTRAAKAFIDGAEAQPEPAHRNKVLRVQERYHTVVKLAAAQLGVSVSAMTEGIIAGDEVCLSCLESARDTALT